jgi:hypothetical protein
MEKDISVVIKEAVEKNKRPVFENETNEMIYNVSTTLCNNMDIPFEPIMDFVMRVSAELIQKNIQSETIYERNSAKMEKDKGKRLVPYKSYRNETIIYIIGGVLLVAVQTVIPSFRTKKTFPGCLRSFSGFPSDGGIEDTTGLKYVACVIHKTKDAIEPWNAIKKNNVEIVTKRIKDVIEKFVMKRADIMERYILKREYILLNPDTVTPEEHNVAKWRHFMPPLVPVDVSRSLHTISADFKNELVNVIRKGSFDQFKMIGILKSKTLKYGYAIIEFINRIVESKTLILKTSMDVPFIENACCNESNDLIKPFVYFNEPENDRNIGAFKKIVSQISLLLKDTNALSKAPLLYNPAFSGMRYPEISNLPSENLIYETIIYYLNLDKDIPIPTKFATILTEKIAMYNKKWSMEEKVEFFKKNGKRFGFETLNQLMKIVNTDNIIPIDEQVEFTQIDVLKDLLVKMDAENSIVFEEPLRDKLRAVLNTYNPKRMMDTNTDELMNLKRYLSKTNDKMYSQIMDFIERYGNISNQQFNKISTFLKNITEWNKDSDIFTITKFIENIIYSVSKVYPSVFISGSASENEESDESGFFNNVPKHWGLSDNHVDNISNFINAYYQKLQPFRSDTVIRNLLVDVMHRLIDVVRFIQNMPIFNELEKQIEDVDGKVEARMFHALFDTQSINMIFSYCLYSCFYEHIIATDDNELLQNDIQLIRNERRTVIRENANVSNLMTTTIVETDEQDIDADAELQEYQIEVGNKQELKVRVCNLLLVYLEIEMENKKATNLSYQEIKEKVGRSKDKEKKGIIRELGALTVEERNVENMLKNLRIGRWNVGQQKGLFQYDKDTYDREVLTMGMQDTETFGEEEGMTGIIETANRIFEIGDLENQAEADADAEEENEIYGLGMAHEGFMDGDYYGDDLEDEEFPDD